MGRNRFELPDVTRLFLSDGDWIEVRRRLSGGEKKRMSAMAFMDFRQVGGVKKTDGDKTGAEQPRIGVDFGLLALARTLTYVKDWNFRDAHDKPVKCTSEAIEALDEETLTEIEKALDVHVEAQEAEKNAQSGEARLSLVPPSVAI